MAQLLDAKDSAYPATILFRLREDIATLATPRKYEYLALMGPKGRHFGEETVYLKDL